MIDNPFAGRAADSVGCTCFALRRLTRTVSRLYDQHMAEVGLKTTQYSLLRWAAHEALPVATLAQRMAVERTTLTRNLRPLVEAGWISLEPGSDARQRVVTVTDAGREKIKAARRAWQAAQIRLQDALGLDQVQRLHRIVDGAQATLSPLLEEYENDDE